MNNNHTQCSAPCGGGEHEREVICVLASQEVVSDERCESEVRPLDEEECNADACSRMYPFRFTAIIFILCVIEVSANCVTVNGRFLAGLRQNTVGRNGIC